MSFPGASIDLNLFQVALWFLLLPGSSLVSESSLHLGREGPSECTQLQGVLEALLLFISMPRELHAGWNVLTSEET